VLLLLPVSFAGCFAVPALTILLMGSIAAERAGTAAGVLNTSRQVGGALSVAVFGALVSGPGSFTSGMHIGLVATAVLLTATGIASVALLPNRRHAAQAV